MRLTTSGRSSGQLRRFFQDFPENHLARDIH